MDSRFTFKDFVFVLLFVVVLGAVIWSIYQSSYQEDRLNAVKQQLQKLNDDQKQQITILSQIRRALESGIHVTAATQSGAGGTQAASSGRIRRTNPDGSQYVYYPDYPMMPRDSHKEPDFATGDWQIRNLASEPKVIEPFIEKDLYGQIAQSPTVETLLQINPDTFQYEPLLAESYWISADGLTYRFRLRKEACFSDGKPVTADDVVFTYNTIMNPDVDCAPLRSFMTSVKSCVKIDDRTVEFHMSEPYFGALNTLGLMLILPEHIYKFTKGEEYNAHGDRLVGSGPYVLQSWERGQRLVYVRNDKYWGPRPTFDKLIFTFIQNPQAALQSLQSGQLDALSTEDNGSPTPDQFLEFSKKPEFLEKFTAEKYARPTSGFYFIGYNEARPMFHDKETRQALTMLIDREAIIHTILKDQAMPTVGPFSPITPQHDPAIKPWPYDPEAAKKKLAEAGWKPGPDGILVRDGHRFEFDFSMGTGNPLGERIANYVKEQFSHAGISMRITPWEFAVLMGRVDDRNFDAIMMGWSAIIEDDPNQVFSSRSIANKGSNSIGFDNKESDALIDEARRTLDTNKRMELWHKWERLISDEQPYTFLYSRLDRAFIDKRFKNTAAYKLGLAPQDWYVPAAAQKYR